MAHKLAPFSSTNFMNKENQLGTLCVHACVHNIMCNAYIHLDIFWNMESEIQCLEALLIEHIFTTSGDVEAINIHIACVCVDIKSLFFYSLCTLYDAMCDAVLLSFFCTNISKYWMTMRSHVNFQHKRRGRMKRRKKERKSSILFIHLP